MALARVKTWVSGEVLLASDLNSEFNNVLNNALTLISPLTASLNAGGFKITNYGGTDAPSAVSDVARNSFDPTWTGAVERVLPEKLGDIVSAKDFGAVGDGVTDNTTFLQAAIDWCEANNATLLIPSGVYRTGSLSLTSVHGITILGQRHAPVANAVGSKLLYTGTGYCISINASGGSSFLYNVNIKDVGIWFEQNCNGGIYAHNLQQSLFDNVGINGDAALTVAYGFDLDAAGICNIDNCVIQLVTTAINTHFDASSQASGPITISRNNIFRVTNGIVFGLVNYLNVVNNYFEWFQSALLFDNGSPRLRTESLHLVIDGNQFAQSGAALAETRVFKMSNSDNSKAVRLFGKFCRNTCYMNAGTATKPSYAMSFALTGNTSVVLINLSVEDNWFWGVTTAGIHSDTAFPTLVERGNDTRDDWLGTLLPNLAGSAPALSSPYVLSKSGAAVSCAADITEDTLATIAVPAKVLGANGAIRITTSWSYTNSGNNKIFRIRYSGASGTAMLLGQATVQLGLFHTQTILNRNATNSQVAYGMGITDTGIVATGSGKITMAIDTTAATSLVITGQKASAGETLTLESYLVEVMPS